MLVLKRKEGQWVEIIHHSGDMIRVRVYDIQLGNPYGPCRANLAFDDSARNFEIRRPERKVLTPAPRPIEVGPTAPPMVAEAVPAIEPEPSALAEAAESA